MLLFYPSFDQLSFHFVVEIPICVFPNPLRIFLKFTLFCRGRLLIRGRRLIPRGRSLNGFRRTNVSENQLCPFSRIPFVIQCRDFFYRLIEFSSRRLIESE